MSGFCNGKPKKFVEILQLFLGAEGGGNVINLSNAVLDALVRPAYPRGKPGSFLPGAGLQP